MLTNTTYVIEIRPATSEDINNVDKFLTEFVEIKKILPRTLDELSQLMLNGFVAVVDGEIVGFATLEVYSRKLAEIRSLCVSPRFQGQGVGKKLTHACIELAKQKMIFEVMVITSEEVFFRNCGFDFTLPGEKKALFLQTRDEP